MVHRWMREDRERQMLAALVFAPLQVDQVSEDKCVRDCG
ncbi:hypothetical protein D8I24_3924 (plasmid) [Cupriavidus necator H850]|nr:hypothetical protein D8I24_3924 [Cupriavidus necator H850]